MPHDQRLDALKQQFNKPLSRRACLKARLQLRTSLDPSYFENGFPQNEVYEPVSGNTAYKAKLMLAYYYDCYEGAERLARVRSWVNVENGHITVRLKNGDQFTDYGNRMTYPSGEIKPSTVRETVLSAKAKGWSAIEVTGFQSFKDDITFYAALNDISCNHELSRVRQLRRRAWYQILHVSGQELRGFSGFLCIPFFGRPGGLVMSANNRTIKEDHAQGRVFAADPVEKTLPNTRFRPPDEPLRSNPPRAKFRG